MKRIAAVFCVLLCLSGCAKGINNPALNTEFEASAVYKTGDFSYNCDIKSAENCVYITPTSTNAAGMTISCNGKKVAFSKGSMLKEFPRESIDNTNPSVILFEVLSAAETIKPEYAEDCYSYKGKASVGNFTLSCDKKGNIIGISIPDAEIEISF